MPGDADFKQQRCADIDGVSPHAAARFGADGQQAPEQLCRYITGPALANVLKLKMACHEVTTYLVMSSLPFMQRLAAQGPRRRQHQGMTPSRLTNRLVRYPVWVVTVRSALQRPVIRPSADQVAAVGVDGWLGVPAHCRPLPAFAMPRSVAPLLATRLAQRASAAPGVRCFPKKFSMRFAKSNRFFSIANPWPSPG